MLYLLLIFLPLALAAGCILDRPWLGVVAAVGLAAVDLAIVLGLSPAAPVLWLGSTLQLGVTNGLVLAGWLLIMSGVALASLLDTAELRLAPVLMLLSSALSAALLVVQPPPAILLLLIASVVGSMLLSHGSFGLSRRYIALALIGAVFLVGVAGLAGTDDRLVIARAGLAVTGLGIWAMLLPMLVIFSPGVERFSLPTLIVLAGALPAISGIVVGSGVAPNGRAALGLAVLALVPAGMLLLMPQTPRQLVALLLVVDGVLLLPGQVLGSSDGLRAALIGSIAHAIAAVALLAGAVAHMWQARYSTRRQVLSSVVLLAGLLLLIGMPPSPGWYARVALWDAARAAGRPSMVLFAIGQLLLMAGAGRLAIGLLRARALPYTNGVAETPARQRGVLLLRAALLVALSAVLVSCFAVRPLLARIDTALAERGPVQDSRSAP